MAYKFKELTTLQKVATYGNYSFKRLADTINYVSLGDSIAAGQSIKSDQIYQHPYCLTWQYGDYDFTDDDENHFAGHNDETTIVEGSYTDLICNRLINKYGVNHVSTKSFSHSGDTVADLIEMLSHIEVKNAIKKADLITICIGANDILGEVNKEVINSYLENGDPTLETLGGRVQTNLNILADDTKTNSYKALFDVLNSINPNAKYVFTTIYNPYKYLYLEDGHYGFFKPLLQAMPDMEILGMDFDSFLKDSLLGTPAIQTLFSRANAIGNWAEPYINSLNDILKQKINNYQTINSNFALADTKAVYDVVPDRPYTADKHYNDLVNVEYTRDYDAAQMDWGKLWSGSDAETFWWDLATKHAKLTSDFGISDLATDLTSQTIEKVIVPDLDPHPETYGHYVLERSFADTLGYQELNRYTITYNANGGTGAMATQKIAGVDGLTAFVTLNNNAFTHSTAGYYFTGWTDSNGNSYSNGQSILLNSNITLYAQWSNMYTITYTHFSDSTVMTDSDTGAMDYYALYIGDTEGAQTTDHEDKLGAFSNPAKYIPRPYGTWITVMVAVESGSDRSYITFNGNKVDPGNSERVYHSFRLTTDTKIEFEYSHFYAISSPPLQSYWNCYITTN